jgi:Holliday junction resolvase
MDAMRRAARTDDNQQEIVAGLRRAGYTVCILSSVGKGVPDLLVGGNGVNVLLEIKDGEKPKSAQKLTVDESNWHRVWKGQVNTVGSLYEALNVLNRVCYGSGLD